MAERLSSSSNFSGSEPARTPRAEDQVADLSDHLARMLAHADALVDEWARFGAQVQGKLNAQLGEIEHAFGEGARAAASKVRAELATAIEAGAGERFDRALGERLVAVRAELERVTRELRGASAATATRDALARRTWLAVLVGNGLLAIAIAALWFRGSSAPQVVAPAVMLAPPIVSPDAAIPDAGAPDAPIVIDAGAPDAAPARPARAVPTRAHRGAR